MARPNKGALQRTRRSEVLVIAAFAFSACEAFLIYRNFRMSVLESPTPTVSLLGGFISVCVTLAACLAMFAAYVLFGKRVGDARHLAPSLACAVFGPALNLIGGHYAGLPFLLLPAAALTSVGCAVFLLVVIREMVDFGVRCSVHCSIACCLSLLVIAPLSIIVSLEGYTALVSAMAVATYACLRKLSSSHERTLNEPQEKQKLPRVLTLTVVLVGMVEGIVAAADEPNLMPYDKFLMFSCALLASAALAAVVLLHTRKSFNTVLYRLCIPLIAIGIAAFSIGGAQALVVGSFAVLTGRQLFAAAILALVVYLVRYHDSDYYLLVLGVLIGAMVGNLIGLSLYQLFGSVGMPDILPAPFIAFVLVFVLIASIWLMDATSTNKMGHDRNRR